METITRRTFNELEQNFDEVRDDYSGRGMYGSECLAIVTDESSWSLQNALRELVNDLKNVDADVADELRVILDYEPESDSMGRRAVYYWPSIKVVEV